MSPAHEPPDLNLLCALEALLDESNVTRAAARVGLSQSAMSHKLRRLRELFDDPLLVGGRGGMVLTPRAESLLGPLRRSLRDVRSVLDGPAPFDPASSTRQFNVVSVDICEFGILPLVVQRVASTAPGVSVSLREPWPGLDQALEDGSADLYVGGPGPDRAGLVQRKIAEERVVCLVRSDHPRVGRSLDLETFVSLPHLVISHGEKNAIDEALEKLGKPRFVAMRIPHFLGGPFIVSRSDLVFTTSESWAHEAASILPVRVVEPPFVLPPVPIYMTWHERFTRDPAHRWLRELSEECTTRVMSAGASRRGAP